MPSCCANLSFSALPRASTPLAVGISFAFVEGAISGAVLTIGIITFFVALAGVYLRHRAGVRYRTPAEVAGGACSDDACDAFY
ncbi:MAG: hypothetical protein JWM84_412 [Nocardioides sp.]|nr:hypothetical protein [Nocardioides sp.]